MSLFYFNYVSRRERRDVDDVVVRFGSRRLDDDNVSTRRQAHNKDVDIFVISALSAARSGPQRSRNQNDENNDTTTTTTPTT